MTCPAMTPGILQALREVQADWDIDAIMKGTPARELHMLKSEWDVVVLMKVRALGQLEELRSGWNHKGDRAAAFQYYSIQIPPPRSQFLTNFYAGKAQSLASEMRNLSEWDGLNKILVAQPLSAEFVRNADHKYEAGENLRRNAPHKEYLTSMGILGFWRAP